MFSLRSNSKPARIASAATLLLAACLLLAAIPALAAAAPAEGEELPVPQLAFEPGSYDFGLQEANRSDSQANFQLRNVGSVPAPVNSVNIVGSGSGAFWTGNIDCLSHSLEPGETCSVQVNFNPYDAVPFSAQLRASSDAGTSFTAGLSGEGGRAALRAATDPTNFGTVPVGSGGVTKTIDVTNEGNMPGSVFIAVISGGAVGSFHLLDESCTGIPLSPDATCNLQVSFDPISTGVKTARLFLAGDGEGGGQLTLSGIASSPNRPRARRTRAPLLPQPPSLAASTACAQGTSGAPAAGLASPTSDPCARAGKLSGCPRRPSLSPTRCAPPASGSRAGRARCGSRRARSRRTPRCCPPWQRRLRRNRRPSCSRGTARPAPPSALCLDAVNFGSGWWPTIRKRPGCSGYLTIAAGLTERFRDGVPWSAAELARLGAGDIAAVVGQDAEHPLMADYAAALRDVGERVGRDHGGSFENVVDAAAGSAVELAGLLAAWDAFADVSTYEGRSVPFFKRAQIAAADIDRMGVAKLRDLDRLTAFADNLVPHVLRVDGVLRLDSALEARIDAGELLEHGSPEEVELRACAVHAIELLAAATPLSPAQIDGILWNRGGTERYKSLPRPRSRNTAY
jgi:hypothetical protein